MREQKILELNRLYDLFNIKYIKHEVSRWTFKKFARYYTILAYGEDWLQRETITANAIHLIDKLYKKGKMSVHEYQFCLDILIPREEEEEQHE